MSRRVTACHRKHRMLLSRVTACHGGFLDLGKKSLEMSHLAQISWPVANTGMVPKQQRKVQTCLNVLLEFCFLKVTS